MQKRWDLLPGEDQALGAAAIVVHFDRAGGEGPDGGTAGGEEEEDEGGGVEGYEEGCGALGEGFLDGPGSGVDVAGCEGKA